MVSIPWASERNADEGMSFRGAGSRKFLPDILSTVGSKELRYPVQQSPPLQLDVPGDTLRPKVDLPGLTWAWFPGPCDPEAQASEFSHYVWLGVSVQAAKDLGSRCRSWDSRGARPVM